MNARVMLAVCLLFVLVSPVLAQGSTCTEAVQEAVTQVRDVCAPTARNQACYGNVMLEATARDGVGEFHFAQQGDIVNVIDLEALRLSSLDMEENIWGVAFMQLQANLPATLPGQNVTFLLFGSVEIENAVPVAPELTLLDMTSSGNINVRGGPSTNVAVIGSLSNGQVLSANGRTADSSWLRVELPDSATLGWVFAELVSTDGDVSTLAVVEADDSALPLQTMQAFRFSTGVGGPACEGAPPDGILIQTPEGAGRISLEANGVQIELGSTAYLQAAPGAAMTISVIEGQATITVDGVTVIIPAGAQASVPLNDDLTPSGPPEEPVPYPADLVAPLPVQALPQVIAIAPPIDETVLADTLAAPVNSGASGGFTGALPGMGGSAAAFTGMELGLFCNLMDAALGDAGISRLDYITMLTQIMPMVPAEDRTGFQEFIDLLMACP